MGYSITKHLTKVNKGTAGENVPEWIVFHFVGASGQAMNNAKYFENTYRGASAHYFVDPKEIVQVVEDNTPAWHIGDGAKSKKGQFNGYIMKGGATNKNSIGIEVCQDTSTGRNAWEWQFHSETLNKVEWLIRELQAKYNIDNDHVIRHFDASGKVCPGNWQHNNWAKWFDFKDRLLKDIKQDTPKGVHNGDEGKQQEFGMYTVQPGDTLYAIAKAHGVTVDQIMMWSKLDNKDLIFPESKLVINGPVPEVKKEEVKVPAQDSKPAAKPAKSIDQLAKEVIDGKHGSGDARKASLGGNYAAVQARVNEILTGKKPAAKPKPAEKTISQLADEVMKGKHGSGRERMISLGSKYAAVQAEVNKRIKKK